MIICSINNTTFFNCHISCGYLYTNGSQNMEKEINIANSKFIGKLINF